MNTALEQLQPGAEKYLQQALKVLKSNFAGYSFVLDHIKLQAQNKGDYDKAVQEASVFADKLAEVHHAGRRIQIMKLKQPIDLNGYQLAKISVDEPKPGELLSGRYWDHVAFDVEDFAGFIDEFKGKGIAFDEFRQIDCDRFTNVNFAEVTLQFRNAPFGENSTRVAAEKSLPEQLQQEKELRLQLLADFQNYRKRVERERMELTDSASKRLLTQLLELLDDCDRSQRHAEETGNKDELHNGFTMVVDKLGAFIKEQGLIELPVKEGDPFNPLTMEAIATVAATEETKDKSVVHVDQKGYMYQGKDQLFRPARVVIAKYPVK